MKIIYKHETGIAVIHPTGEIPVEAVFTKDVPTQYLSTAFIVDDEVIPTDRTFRDAWDYDHSVNVSEIRIVEDVAKAKEIHKNRLRAERKPLLDATDVQFMKALETGEDTKQIVTEKQRLRDITKLVDACETIDDIKKVSV